jgi:hypothetical protein
MSSYTVLIGALREQRLAAESGSFLMHFILSALNLHLEQMVQLRWHKDTEKPEIFLKGVSQVLAAYRYVFSFLPKNYERNSFGFLEFEKLKVAILRALKEQDVELTKEIMATFWSFYRQAREKNTDKFTALRIYVDMVELGAIASVSGMTEIGDQIVEKASIVQREQIDQHINKEDPESDRKEVAEALSREIWRIYSDYHQYHPMRHDDIKLESMISTEDLKAYLNRIEKMPHDREATEFHSRGMF